VAVALAVFHVYRNRDRSLRDESKVISDFNAFVIRSIFWAVFIVGLVDMGLAFLEVEGLLDGVFGKTLALDLVRQQIRVYYILIPLIALSVIIGAYTRTVDPR
jgi:hypothetical protein